MLQIYDLMYVELCCVFLGLSVKNAYTYTAQCDLWLHGPSFILLSDFSHDAPHASEIRLTSSVIHSASLEHKSDHRRGG